jgi:HD-like signal output (HDOD) protein/CheY-like chemotaxis protein
MRILFVDDEPAVLEGLENRLRKRRREWSMDFAESAEDALEELSLRDFDVVVTDMRMPGMDGAELLRRVRSKHPQVVRIVLTGQADEEGIIRAVSVAHRFLAKPCEAATLEAALERTHTLQALLRDASVRRVICGIARLPILPRVRRAIIAALQQPESQPPDVADLLEQDLPTTARVLQVANSTLFGLTREITTIRDAVAYLGLNTVQNLMLSGDLFAAQDQGPAVAESSLSTLPGKARRAAHIAAAIVDDEEDSKVAYSAALLSDLGTLVLATALPELHEASSAHASSAGIPPHEAEERIHGFTHAEIGAYLLALWGLPHPIVEAVAYHHRPGRGGGSTFGVAGAVHVAACLAHASGPGGIPDITPEGLDMDYLKSVGVIDRIPAWIESAWATQCGEGMRNAIDLSVLL